MENYILQILESSTRVIVPEFGAFIVKQRNPLTVVFNEFLQYNDGVMVDTIAKNENISHEDAKKKIDDYVKSIIAALDRGEYFPVGKLGMIIKGATGKISLEKDIEVKQPAKKEASKTSDAVKTTKKAVAGKKKPEPKTASSKETKTLIKKEPVAKKSAIASAPEKEVKKEVEKQVTYIPPAVEEIKEKPIAEEKKQPIVQEKVTKVSETKPSYKPAELSHKAEPKKNNRIFKTIFFWVLILVIVNVIVFGYLIYSDELKGIFSSKDQDTSVTKSALVEEPSSEEMLSDETPLTTDTTEISSIEEPTNEIPVSKKISSADVRFYIVAGVFRDEGNANKLVDDLKRKGYNSEKFGKIGSLHAVSYDVFATKQEADKFLIKVQKEIDPEAWIRAVK